MASAVRFFHKHHSFLLAALWLLQVALFLYWHGPKITYDGHRYIEYARGLWNAEWVSFRYFWYIGYITFLAAAMKLSSSALWGAVILQALISGLAAIYLYKSTLVITKSYFAAFLTTLLFIFWFRVQVWNYFILTESLFTSNLIFLFYAFVRKNWRGITILSPVVFFIRPTGIIVLVATLFASLYVSRISPAIKISLLVFTCLTGLLLINRVLANYGLVEEYSSGKIVYSADRVKDKKLKERLYIKSSQPITAPESTGIPIYDGFNFFVKNPVFTVKLIGTRIAYFLLDYRPYHSLFHTIANSGLLIFCYVFSGIFFRRYKRYRLAKTWFLIFLTGSILMAGFACITWEGRLFAPLYPFLFVFASSGASLFFTKKPVFSTSTSQNPKLQ